MSYTIPIYTAEGMFNPAQKDLDMSLNAIRNVALLETVAMNTGSVVAGDSLAIGTAPSQVTLTALGVATQAYNFPVVMGQDTQVLALDGNSGQLKWEAMGGAGGVTSVNTVAGDVNLVSMTLNITPSGQDIAIDIPSVVTSLNGLNADVGITSSSLTVDQSGQNITVDLPSGGFVTSVSGLSGGTASGTVTLTSISLDVVTQSSTEVSIDLRSNIVNDVNTISGSLSIAGGAGITVDTNTAQTVTISTSALAGLASPQLTDVGNTSFSITNVSTDLTNTSVVLSCIQVPDQPGDQSVWLTNTYPTGSVSGDGGSLTFNFASAITASSQLQVAYHIPKF